jgi:gas vesicle protein
MAEAKGINLEITPEVVTEEFKEMLTENKEEVKEATAEMVDAIRPARKRRADKVRKLAHELAKPRNRDIGFGGGLY